MVVQGAVGEHDDCQLWNLVKNELASLSLCWSLQVLVVLLLLSNDPDLGSASSLFSTSQSCAEAVWATFSVQTGVPPSDTF